MGVAIEIQRLTKSFPHPTGGGQALLKNLSLSVNDGEFCCILGPSGSGKTTLLNLISGLADDFSGSITRRENGTARAPDQVVTGRVFQEPRLLPWLTVYENVRLVLQSKSWKREKVEENIQEFLQRVKLWDQRAYYPHQLSGGMQQRVAIARAFAVEPQLLLLDEPFSALDEPLAHELSDVLLEIWDFAPKTVLFVTHNILDAMRLGDQLNYLDGNHGGFSKTWRVDIPRPRDPHDPEFYEVYLAVTEHVKEAAAKASRR